MATTKKKETKTRQPATKRVKVLNTTLNVKELQSGSKIDIVKAIKQRANGATLQEIADTFSVTSSAVHQALEPYKANLDDLVQYRDNKGVFADMVSNKVYKAILNKPEEDIASEKLSSLGAFLKTQHDISRLDAGLSTSNVSLKIVDLTQYTGENES